MSLPIHPATCLARCIGRALPSVRKVIGPSPHQGVTIGGASLETLDPSHELRIAAKVEPGACELADKAQLYVRGGQVRPQDIVPFIQACVQDVMTLRDLGVVSR